MIFFFRSERITEKSWCDAMRIDLMILLRKLMVRTKKNISDICRRLNLWRYRLQGVKIGNGCFISLGAKIDTTYPDSVLIEDFVYITYGAIVLAHDHTVYRVFGKECDDGRGVTRICRNAFIGAGAIIMRNVTVGNNSIVAAGAVVTKNVPSNCVVAGNPAVVIKEFVVREIK